MTCTRCGRQVIGLIENHDCKVERMIKCTKCGKVINDIYTNANSTGYQYYRDNRFCKCTPESRSDQLKKENEDLKRLLNKSVEALDAQNKSEKVTLDRIGAELTGVKAGLATKIREIDRLEKEVLRLKEEYQRECNEKDDLKSALEGIASCISNPRTGYQEAIEYAYETAMEALGEDV